MKKALWGLLALLLIGFAGALRRSELSRIDCKSIERTRGLIITVPKSKTDQDCREDFRDVFDLDRELVQGFRIELDEVEWTR